MSKEFEKIVLKKLEVLDNRTKNTDRVTQEVVLKKLDILDNRTKETDRVTQEVVLKKLDMLDNRTKNTDKVIEEVVLKKLEKIDNLEIELKNTKKMVNNLNNNFTRFDYEINLKIDTLFDAIKLNNEKHEIYEENITSLNAKTFNHNIRISNLEDKVLTA